jgi:hypothetical protein
MEGTTKIGRTAALAIELNVTVFTSTGERRVAQLSRLLQASVVFGTAPKPRSARPESSLAPARRVSGPSSTITIQSPHIESNP